MAEKIVGSSPVPVRVRLGAEGPRTHEGVVGARAREPRVLGEWTWGIWAQPE